MAPSGTFVSLTKRQWVTMLSLSMADFFSSVCISLQAPFFPYEAESKGASATESGLVFGIYELSILISGPLLGRQMSRIGTKRMVNFGVMVTGVCSVIFGLLNGIQGRVAFITAAILVRCVEAVGNAGFITACFSLVAKEFPERVASMFALVETFFGLGLIAGPSIGSVLYQMGGYTLPFVTLGSILVAASLVTCFTLPSTYNQAVERNPQEESQRRGLLDAFKVPAIAFSMFVVFSAALCISFVQATLEPHMRQFDLTPAVMSAMFILNGGSYAFSAPFWGYLCDKKLKGVLVMLMGSVLILLSMLFLGPASFIPFPTVFEVCIASLVVMGLGIGAELVSGFSVAHHEALLHGFPEDLDTYSLISSSWTSSFALGAFVGPILAGILVDSFSFKVALILVLVSQLLVFMISASFYCHWKITQRRLVAYNSLDCDSIRGQSARSISGTLTLPTKKPYEIHPLLVKSIHRDGEDPSTTLTGSGTFSS